MVSNTSSDACDWGNINNAWGTMGRMNRAEEISVAIATVLGASLSLSGSLFIIYNILARRKYNRGSYHRLLLGLMLCDALSSVGWLMAPLAPPRDTSPRYLSIGNTASCTISAFLLQVGIGFPIYNACLSIFYMLTICYNMKKKEDMLWREAVMHFVALTFAFGTAFIPVPYTLYNELSVGVGCWIVNFPEDCAQDPNLDCVRGSEMRLITPSLLGYSFAAGPAVVSMFVVIWCNVRIFYTSRRLARRIRRHSISSLVDAYPDQQTRRTALIASQAMYYVIVFLNSMTWQIVLKVLDNFDIIRPDNETFWTTLILFAQFFSSSAGFGFLLTYVRPRYLRYRERNFSRGQALFLALMSSKEQRLSRAASVNPRSDSSDSLDLSKEGNPSGARSSIYLEDELEMEEAKLPETSECEVDDSDIIEVHFGRLRRQLAPTSSSSHTICTWNA